MTSMLIAAPVSFTSRVARVVRAVALSLTAFTVACTDNSAATIDVATLEVTPATADVQAGVTVALTARAFDANGTPIPTPILRWSSSAPAVATVSATGVVTTTAAGTAQIAVSSMGRSAVAMLVVAPRAVASVIITPPQASVLIAGTTRLSAVPLDAAGAPLTGRPISWASSDVTVARVDANGTVTGVAPGAATITATCEGRTAQSAVTVSLPPVQTIALTPARDTLAVSGARQYLATVRDASGTLLTGRSIGWSTSNVNVAIVSATGAVTALSPGTTTVTASSEGRSATSTLVVLARLASAVTVTPGLASVVVGNTLTLATQITDAAGNILIDRPISFTSEAPGIATVSANGTVTAISPGSARIVASSEGKTGSATVQVLPVPVATLQLTPTSTTLTTGESLTLATSARAASGALLTGRTIEWRSGAPNVATISAAGVVNALTPGVAVILATTEGVTASTTVTVRLPSVASITLSPLLPVVDIGQGVQLVAALRTARGELLTNRVVTWRSSNEQVAFVSSTGLVVGTRSGNAVITATSEGVSATTVVTVR